MRAITAVASNVAAINRELTVAPEVAAALPASHLAQLQQDAAAPDNVCVACGALIEGPVAELIVLHDDRAVLARLAHPDCVGSGVYAWPGTSEAVAGLTLRPDGVDVATALVCRPGPPAPATQTDGATRALVLIEPRIHISLGDDPDADPLRRLFAEPLGLAPVAGALDRLRPPPAAQTTIARTDDALTVASPRLTVTAPARPELIARWRAHVDHDRAVVFMGRGLGITDPAADLAATLGEALAVRPCWAATVAVHVDR